MMAGYSPERIDHVRFSIVAFADEVVLNSDWTYRNDWLEKPMQYEEFETTIAGDQFFDRLEQLIAEVKSAAPIVPGEEILLPGEAEQRRMQERLKNGIPVDVETVEKLKPIAADVGVPFPL